MNGQTSLFEKHRGIRVLVERKLRAFLSEKVAEADHPELNDAFHEISRFALNGGKRMRPLFCYWGWRGAAGPDDAVDDIVAVAAAVELFHVAALIHDDIVDRSELRRGRPTLHRNLARRHGESGWQGDGAHFGLSAALLAGDASLVWSEELFHDRWRAVRSPCAMSLFSRLRADAVRGEFLDILGETRGGSLDDAFELIRYKTARYTVSDPLELGGTIAGAEDDVIASYREFGLLVGEAYQLRDDLFGFFGSPAITGKSNLDDIRQGKLTVLIMVARDLADPERAERIEKLYGAPWVGEAEVAELQDIVLSVGAREAIEELIRDRHHRALEALTAARIDEVSCESLRQLAKIAVDRTS